MFCYIYYVTLVLSNVDEIIDENYVASAYYYR